MPEILPVSELRSYTDVLAKVGDGSPVFLTRNGRGAYAILTMEDYDRVTARQTPVSALAKGRARASARAGYRRRMFARTSRQERWRQGPTAGNNA